MYDIAIIGAGIAGLTASLYSARAGKKVLLLESTSIGGQIINAKDVKNYPGYKKIDGVSLIKNIQEQVQEYNIDYKCETVVEINENEVITQNDAYECKAIIIATGLKKRPLGLYLEQDFIGRGVTYCATCDGNFYKGKNVAVVGGGNTAIEDALYLSNLVNKLYVIHRNSTFRAEQTLVDELKEKDNITFLMNTEVIKLDGDEKLSQITVKEEAQEKEIKVDGLFIAVGQIPDNLRFSNLVDLDEQGFIISNDCRTKQKNIFVAGDCRTKNLRQLVTASSDGAIAANLAINYLK